MRPPKMQQPPVIYQAPAPLPIVAPLERKALSIEEAAEVLGLGRNATLRLLHDGLLRHIRCGKRVIVPVAAIDEFLAPRAS